MDYELIYRKYAKFVYKYLMSLCHNSDVAEEVTQETFCQAIQCIDKYDHKCKMTTWLCGIAKNQLRSYTRKNPQISPLFYQDGDGDEITAFDRTEAADSPEDKILGQEEKISLLQKLHCLDEPYREIIYLRIFGELSFKEIALIFGQTETWARVSFYRGKNNLKKELDNHEE